MVHCVCVVSLSLCACKNIVKCERKRERVARIKDEWYLRLCGRMCDARGKNGRGRLKSVCRSLPCDLSE